MFENRRGPVTQEGNQSCSRGLRSLVCLRAASVSDEYTGKAPKESFYNSSFDIYT